MLKPLEVLWGLFILGAAASYGWRVRGNLARRRREAKRTRPRSRPAVVLDIPRDHGSNLQIPPHRVTVVESYLKAPPFDFKATVEVLLHAIPPTYLVGLGSVVLADAAGLNRSRKRAKTWSRERKVGIRECLGLYHCKWQGQPAWIELFVDNIISSSPAGLWWIRPLREREIGQTLYHEIGHHIHATQAPRYREREDVADEWSTCLTKHFVQRRHWYLRPIMQVSWMIRGGIDFIMFRR